MSVPHRSTLAAIALSLACGPQLDAPEGGTTGAVSASTATTGLGPDSSGTAIADDSTGDDQPVATSAAATDDGFGTAYEDDGGSDEGCTFTCPSPPGPPGGGVSSFECDLELQDCPEGEKCMPWANDGRGWWNSTRCAPLDPTPAGPGEACQIEGSFYSGIDDCELGAMCQSDDLDVTDGTGTCVEICTGTCADPDQACLQLFAGIPQCSQACDPLDPAACPDGRVCGPLASYDAASGFVCLPISASVLPQDAPCTFAHECSPGLFCAWGGDVPECADGPGDACCVPLCDVLDPEPTCPAASGRLCSSASAVPGTMWEGLGLCVLPA